jgi:hypothetical protein
MKAPDPTPKIPRWASRDADNHCRARHVPRVNSDEASFGRFFASDTRCMAT